jgi:hypothetical protein
MVRWMGLEPMTDGLENRCSIRLSYHRLRPDAEGIRAGSFIDKGKAEIRTLRDVFPRPSQSFTGVRRGAEGKCRDAEKRRD